MVGAGLTESVEFSTKSGRRPRDEPHGCLGQGFAGQREQHLPRPWGRSMAVAFEDRQGCQGGWSRARGGGMVRNEATGMMGAREGEQITRVLSAAVKSRLWLLL